MPKYQSEFLERSSLCQPPQLQYTVTTMHRRLIAIALMLAVFIQGPALAYAATLGAAMSDATTQACNGQVHTEGSDCQSCCAHGAMPSCATQCPAPASAAPVLTPPTLERAVPRGIMVPDLKLAPFSEHAPPHPLRPPIV